MRRASPLYIIHCTLFIQGRMLFVPVGSILVGFGNGQNRPFGEELTVDGDAGKGLLPIETVR